MILVTNVLFALAVLFTGAWRRWRKYYDTILLVSFWNVFYNFICHDYLTWKFQPDFLLAHKPADMTNTFVLLPSVTLLYLGFFPSRRKPMLVYYIAWVAGFSALEGSWMLSGYISYEHGWSLWWSVAFYFVMFAIIPLHARRKGWALAACAVFVLFLLLYFDVPMRE
ncbi:CBO0543 family protein [Paenibacillus xanthanilyticus]|uniref:CBO0543 family protein n=1 Tax=Paenibacillus xanthanilyticus TaxID=1783531 RepID=A0ABV8KD98_9BACL